jgi:hypothetical protein
LSTRYWLDRESAGVQAAGFSTAGGKGLYRTVGRIIHWASAEESNWNLPVGQLQ